MRFRVEAADRNTGQVHAWDVDASSTAEAEQIVNDAGYLVSAIAPISDPIPAAPAQQQQRPQRVIVHTPPSNAVGTTGLVLSVLGLFCFGILAPVGMVVSLVGLFYEPKGNAVAGVLVGMFATVGWVILALFGMIPCMALGAA